MQNGNSEWIRMTLRAARVNVGLPQKIAANKLGVSNKTLGSWENGETSPTIEMMPKICELYGVPMNQLYFLQRNPL